MLWDGVSDVITSRIISELYLRVVQIASKNIWGMCSCTWKISSLVPALMYPINHLNWHSRIHGLPVTSTWLDFWQSFDHQRFTWWSLKKMYDSFQVAILSMIQIGHIRPIFLRHGLIISEYIYCGFEPWFWDMVWGIFFSHILETWFEAILSLC